MRDRAVAGRIARVPSRSARLSRTEVHPVPLGSCQAPARRRAHQCISIRIGSVARGGSRRCRARFPDHRFFPSSCAWKLPSQFFHVACVVRPLRGRHFHESPMGRGRVFGFLSLDFRTPSAQFGLVRHAWPGREKRRQTHSRTTIRRQKPVSIGSDADLERHQDRGGAGIPPARIRPQGLQICWRIGSGPDQDRPGGGLRLGYEEAVTKSASGRSLATRQNSASPTRESLPPKCSPRSGATGPCP